MAVYYDNTSLKAKHERKRSLEELTKENKELRPGSRQRRRT